MGKLAGQHNPQLGPHFFAQAGVAFSLRSLPLQRIHLSRDFFEDVIDAGQVLLGIFKARFRQPLLGFEFRNPRSFLNDRPPVGGTAAQDLADASLFDQGIRLRPQAGSHEQFLNVSQAAQLSVEQIFAIAGTEEPTRDCNLA